MPFVAKTGEIWMRTDSMMSGYLKTKTQRMLRSKMEIGTEPVSSALDDDRLPFHRRRLKDYAHNRWRERLSRTIEEFLQGIRAVY